MFLVYMVIYPNSMSGLVFVVLHRQMFIRLGFAMCMSAQHDHHEQKERSSARLTLVLDKMSKLP